MTNHVGATAQLFSVTRAAVDPSSLTTFISTAVETALDLLFYSIWETPDLVATGGGIPYENRFRLYVGLTNNLALNRQVERVKSDPEAERYARMFYQTKGNLERPLVTLHNLLDPIVPFEPRANLSRLSGGPQKSRFFNRHSGSGLWPLRVHYGPSVRRVRNYDTAGYGVYRSVTLGSLSISALH